jgi:hypothetical protein
MIHQPAFRDRRFQCVRSTGVQRAVTTFVIQRGMFYRTVSFVASCWLVCIQRSRPSRWDSASKVAILIRLNDDRVTSLASCSGLIARQMSPPVILRQICCMQAPCCDVLSIIKMMFMSVLKKDLLKQQVSCRGFTSERNVIQKGRPTSLNTKW